jgi:hypothetical protein
MKGATMADVRVMEELFVKAPTKVGLLAEVTEELAAAGVDIRGIGAYDKDDQGEFMLLTGDNGAAEEILVDMGASVERNDVVVVTMEQRAGELQKISRTLADAGINVNWVYATTGDGSHTNVVLRTDDAMRTAEVLGE